MLPSHPHEIHPVWEKMNLTICILSGENPEKYDLSADAKEAIMAS